MADRGVKRENTQSYPLEKKRREDGVQETGYGDGLNQDLPVPNLVYVRGLNVAVACSDTGQGGGLNIAVAVSGADGSSDRATVRNHGYDGGIAIQYPTLGRTLAVAARDDEEELPAK